MFKRKIYSDLLKWKQESEGTSALLIEGARRIGKSTVVEEFAKNEYRDYVIIDFSIAEQAVKDNFENIGNMDTFFRNLFIIVGKTLPQRESVIIFDEVQLFPKARQAIKHLVKDGRFDYIETGSLISINKNVKDILIPSEEEIIQMYPMDFEEFLWAIGNHLYAEVIRDAYKSRKPLGADNHRRIMQTFRNYLAVGGMPQAVSAYVDGKDFVSIDRVKRNILKLYTKDLQKHDEYEGDRAGAVFRSLPEQLSNHNHIFKFSTIDANARTRNCRSAIDFLLVKGKRIVPIEVKSSDYKNHKSFDYFKEKYQLKMNERYIIYTKDMEWKDDILFMPIYMTMCL